jgi:hypothetical protein
MKAANEAPKAPSYTSPEHSPTDVEPETATPDRPLRGKLHGADDPRGFFANRGAALRTVRRDR